MTDNFADGTPEMEANDVFHDIILLGMFPSFSFSVDT